MKNNKIQQKKYREIEEKMLKIIDVNRSALNPEALLFRSYI